MASSAREDAERIHVASCPRVHVGLDQLASPIVAERAERRLLAPLGQPLVDGLAGALQGAVDRSDRRLQRLRHPSGREAEHLAQKEDGALRGREVLERRDERELNRLALLVARLGRRVAVQRRERRIREGIQPGRLDERLADVADGVARGAVLDRKHRAGRRAIASMQTLVAIR